MKNSPVATQLFAQARGHIADILHQIQEYEEIREVLEHLGYGAGDEDGFPLPGLELVGVVNGYVTIDDPDVLDEYYERGPISPRKEAPKASRTGMGAPRYRLGKASGWRCFYCHGVGSETVGPDERMWHVDHVYPLVRGGDNEDDNHVLACATCNLKKHALSAMEHFQNLKG